MKMTELAPLLRGSTQRSGAIPEPITGSSQSPEQDSKIWKAALPRYYGELANGGYKRHTIDKDVWDIKDSEEFFDQIKALPASSKGPEDLNVLKKVVVGLSDSAAVAALVLDMNG
jgi:hypothetical protein